MTRRPQDPTTPTDTVLGHISCGGVTETALIARVMSHHSLTYSWAETAVKSALTDLLLAKRIEQIAPGVSAYQLCASAKFEADTPTKAKGAAKYIGGYRNYTGPSTDDKTPVIGTPMMSEDGE